MPRQVENPMVVTLWLELANLLPKSPPLPLAVPAASTTALEVILREARLAC